jgi:ankyrin repeat protein
MSDVPADFAPDNAPDDALLRAIDAADIDAVRALLDTGANPNTAATLPAVADAIPALYFPCVTNNVAIARLLLERGANPDDGESLYHAAEHDHRECLELLQSYGANLSGRNATYGNTPLHFLAAILHSNLMAPSAMRGMRWLLENGADPNVASHRSASGATLPGSSLVPLHWAAWNARPAMVSVLLDHHAPVNHRDARYGSSPIAWAAHGSQWNDKGSDDDYVMITTMLLDAGSTRHDAINRWDEAPESFARPAVLRVLRERGFIP